MAVCSLPYRGWPAGGTQVRVQGKDSYAAALFSKMTEIVYLEHLPVFYITIYTEILPISPSALIGEFFVLC